MFKNNKLLLLYEARTIFNEVLRHGFSWALKISFTNYEVDICLGKKMIESAFSSLAANY